MHDLFCSRNCKKKSYLRVCELRDKLLQHIYNSPEKEGTENGVCDREQCCVYSGLVLIEGLFTLRFTVRSHGLCFGFSLETRLTTQEAFYLPYE